MTKILNPIQEPTNIQQIPKEDVNDMYVLYTYKLRQGVKIQNMALLKVKNQIKIMSKLKKTKSGTSNIIQSPFNDMTDKLNWGGTVWTIGPLKIELLIPNENFRSWRLFVLSVNVESSHEKIVNKC